MSMVQKYQRICDGCESEIPDNSETRITISGSFEIIKDGARVIGYGPDGLHISLDYCDYTCFGQHVLEAQNAKSAALEEASRKAGL